MEESNVHPLITFAKNFLMVLHSQPHTDVAELRALATGFGGWAGAIIEVEALRKDPTGLSDALLQDLTNRFSTLLEASRNHWQLLQVGCLGAANLLRASAKAGFEVGELSNRFDQHLSELAKASDAHDFGVRLSRFLLLEGLYDAKLAGIDHTEMHDSGSRCRQAEEILEFISNRLDPARNDRKELLERIGSTAAREEISRMDIAQEHRRLSWETSLAAEKYGDKPDHPSRWIALASRYAAIGDSSNEAGALSNGLERFVEVWERSNRPEVLSSITELAEQLREVVKKVPDEFSGDLIKVIVRADLAVGDSGCAERAIRAILKTKCAQLCAAGDDEFRRSYLLRDADDWLGLAAATSVDLALEARATLRPGFPGDLPINSGGSTIILYPILGRQRAGIIYHDHAQLVFLPVTSAHDVARAIHDLHRFARRDIKDYRTGTPSEERWRESLSRLAGMLRIRDLRGVATNADVVFLLDGSAVHVPWPALLTSEDVDCKSVELRLLLGGSMEPNETTTKNAITINTFKKFPVAEQWHQGLEQISHSLGAECFGWDSVPGPELCDLALIGAHGLRETFGDLSLEVGDQATRIAAPDFAKRIPIGITTFCGICYGGGGFLSGAGDWQSMPGLLLGRGARRVLANVWPAWDLPSVRGELADLIRDVRNAASTRDAAVVVTAWQKRSKSGHPRWWSGWGLWSRCT